LAASTGQAGTLTSATWSQATQGFPMTRTGGQIGITGTSTGTSIAASLEYPQFSAKFFVPKTANGVIDLAVSITQGGPQNLTATPGMAAATMGVPGTVNVRTAVHNTKGVSQSTYMTGINTLVMVPVSVGVGGQFTGSFIVLGINHFITVDFYGWTPNSYTFTGLTTIGSPLPKVTAAGSWNLTANGGGTVTLVSPSKIRIDCALAQRRTVDFTSLKMYFVPEPATLLLLGAASLALALRTRRGH
jgi:hypothetical protein